MLIFTIPIYCYTKDKLHENYTKYLQKHYTEINRPKNDILAWINYSHPNINILDNYIVGYIKIYYSQHEITYELLNIYSKKYLSQKELDKAIKRINDSNMTSAEKDSYINGYKQSYSEVQYVIPFASKKKHYMSCQNIMGYHTIIDTNDTNNEIVSKIREDLDEITKDELSNKVFIDLQLFNNLSKFIDFKQLFDEIDKS